MTGETTGATAKGTPEAMPPSGRGGDDLAALLEDSRELLMVLDGAGDVRWLSPAANRWLGSAAVGHPLAHLVHATDADPVGDTLSALTARAATDVRTSGLTCRMLSAEGGWRPVELTIIDRRDHRTIAGLVCVAREIVETDEVAARLIHQASHDTLTCLPNRSLLLDRLSETGEHGGDRPCAVLYLDLDGFKAVNDSLGHAAGDRVLVTVADRLRRVVRPGDTVARLHGDEFVVVAAGVSDPTIAFEIAERIVMSIRRPIALDGRLINVSVSVGLSLGHGSGAAALLEEADRAMFGAKQAGRNRCALFSVAMRTVDDQRLADEQVLRDALDDHGLTLLFQPIVELRTRQLAGVEAVLRIRRQDGTLVTPTGFMAIAEETGLATAVGSGLLDLACAQAAAWRRELGGAAPTLLSVPTSLRQLGDPRAADRVAGTLERHGVDPSSLCLDLPGRSLADASSAMTRTLERLKGLGVRLAVDGFGCGSANLSDLRRHSIDLLRIDRSLMAGLGHDEGETEVVRAVVGLGEALGMTTVATGVETELQAQLLDELGCHLAQGMYFGRPAPAGESPLLGR